MNLAEARDRSALQVSEWEDCWREVLLRDGNECFDCDLTNSSRRSATTSRTCSSRSDRNLCNDVRLSPATCISEQGSSNDRFESVIVDSPLLGNRRPNQTRPDPTRPDLIRPYLDRTPESTRCKQNRPYKSQTNLIRVVLT